MPSTCTMALQRHCLPGGGSSDLIIVILSQNLEQLVEKNRQKPNNHCDSLHAEEALEMYKE